MPAASTSRSRRPRWPRRAHELAQAIAASGRGVVSARVRSPTFGGASWLAHAALLAGLDTGDPAQHDLLLASQRPTLVRHFARHGYRTVGWMPGLKRAWPEGAFYGFDRLADDAGIGYLGPDFGFWRIPDQAAMALLHAQELDRSGAPAGRASRASSSSPPPARTRRSTRWRPSSPTGSALTGARRLQPRAGRDRAGRAAGHAATAAELPAGMRYQFDWLSGYPAATGAAADWC